MAVAYLQEHLLDKGGNLDLDLQNIVGLPKVLVDIVFGAFSASLVCRLLITRTLEIIDTVDRVCQTANTERMELVVSEIESWSWSDKEHFDILTAPDGGGDTVHVGERKQEQDSASN